MKRFAILGLAVLLLIFTLPAMAQDDDTPTPEAATLEATSFGTDEATPAEPTADATQEATPLPSATPLPTATHLPTATPLPTLTALPTLTPIPDFTPTPVPSGGGEGGTGGGGEASITLTWWQIIAGIFLAMSGGGIIGIVGLGRLAVRLREDRVTLASIEYAAKSLSPEMAKFLFTLFVSGKQVSELGEEIFDGVPISSKVVPGKPGA